MTTPPVPSLQFERDEADALHTMNCSRCLPQIFKGVVGAAQTEEAAKSPATSPSATVAASTIPVTRAGT